MTVGFSIAFILLALGFYSLMVLWLAKILLKKIFQIAERPTSPGQEPPPMSPPS